MYNQRNITMKFNLKMSVVLKKDFTIEAEHLKDAQDIAEKQLMEEVALNSLEITHIGLDMTDPSIREYNRKMGRKILKEHLEKRDGSKD